MIALGIISGCLITFLICLLFYYFSIRPRLIEVQQKNLITNQEIENQLNTYKQAVQQKEETQEDLAVLTEMRAIVTKDLAAVTSQRDEMLSNITRLKDQIDDNISLYFDNALNVMQDRFEESAIQERDLYLSKVAEYKNEYLSILQDAAAEFDAELLEKKERLAATVIMLDEAAHRLAAAIEAEKRAADENKDIYRLQLSDVDLNEIIRLREIIPYLREARPLNKMIWEGYYQKPYKDLISRVFTDKKVVTGIYKLTNLTNKKSYIGQAIDIATRWSEHIKKGLGIDTNNQIIYTAMKEVGPENFTFEILEECPQKDLNAKEKYWISFFKTTEYGYNMKVG